MTRTPTYDDLAADGEALRRRLSEIIVSAGLVDALVRDIRAWEVRCATTVAVRNLGLAATFRVETGSIQRLMGDAWFPTPGWQAQLDDALAGWLVALERLRSRGSRERHVVRGRPAEP